MSLPAGVAVRLTAAERTRRARLLGFGAAQPAGRLTGAELGERVGRAAQWIESRTGIREIRCLGPDETLVGLAIDAARGALADAAGTDAAGTDAAGAVTDPAVDLVIGATCSQTTGVAQLAAQVARAVAPAAATMDLNAACAGFCYSLATADALVRDGAARRVLIVAAEHMTGIVDPADLGTSIIFGDGAGAAVVGSIAGSAAGTAPGTAAGSAAGSAAGAVVAGDPAGDRCAEPPVHIGAPVWGSDGDGAGLIAMAADTNFLAMSGQPVFRWAVEKMPNVARAACRAAGVTLADIEVFVPHQANARIVDALTVTLGLQHAVVSRDITVSGNTSAASVPIALTKLRRLRLVRPGQLALIMGFGAGLSYAAQVVRLP